MIDDANMESFRRVCEARHWLRQGYTSAGKVRELEARVAGQRGAAAASQLVEDMREQWRHRREWMQEPGA